MSAASAMHDLADSLVLALLLGLCVLMAGCATEQEEEQPNLRSIAAYYSQYRATHRGQVPANAEDFRNFIRDKRRAAMGNASAESLESDIDQLFISNRDGKPFVVKYRGDKSWPYPEVVVYEQEGSGGTRHVATVTGGYEQWSDEMFRNNTPASAKR